MLNKPSQEGGSLCRSQPLVERHIDDIGLVAMPSQQKVERHTDGELNQS